MLGHKFILEVYPIVFPSKNSCSHRQNERFTIENYYAYSNQYSVFKWIWNPNKLFNSKRIIILKHFSKIFLHSHVQIYDCLTYIYKSKEVIQMICFPVD